MTRKEGVALFQAAGSWDLGGGSGGGLRTPGPVDGLHLAGERGLRMAPGFCGFRN